MNQQVKVLVKIYRPEFDPPNLHKGETNQLH